MARYSSNIAQVRWKVLAGFVSTVVIVLALITIVLGAYPNAYFTFPLPIGRAKGAAMVGRTAYVASSTSGRLITIDLDRESISWQQMPQRPISLAIENNEIVVKYGHQKLTVAKDVPDLPVHDAVTVEYTWLGHPFLEVSDAHGQSRISMQPWYLTLVQSPWPGLLYGPAVIFSLAFSGWFWRLKSNRIMGQVQL